MELHAPLHILTSLKISALQTPFPSSYSTSKIPSSNQTTPKQLSYKLPCVSEENTTTRYHLKFITANSKQLPWCCQQSCYVSPKRLPFPLSVMTFTSFSLNKTPAPSANDFVTKKQHSDHHLPHSKSNNTPTFCFPQWDNEEPLSVCKVQASISTTDQFPFISMCNHPYSLLQHRFLLFTDSCPSAYKHALECEVCKPTLVHKLLPL